MRNILSIELFRLSAKTKSQLALSTILILVFGVITLFATRYILESFYPEDFVRHYPTISRTGSIKFYPGNIVFGIGLCLVSLCIFVATRIGYQAKLSMARNELHYRLYPVDYLALSFQLFAGLFLALLAIINSGINGPLHEQLSVAFFTCQAFAIILEAISRRVGKLTFKTLAGSEKAWDAFRDIQSSITIILAILLLWLHLLDGYFLDDKGLHRHLFAWIEYSIAILFFSYPATYYVQIRDYYLQRERL